MTYQQSPSFNRQIGMAQRGSLNQDPFDTINETATISITDDYGPQSREAPSGGAFITAPAMQSEVGPGTRDGRAARSHVGRNTRSSQSKTQTLQPSESSAAHQRRVSQEISTRSRRGQFQTI